MASRRFASLATGLVLGVVLSLAGPPARSQVARSNPAAIEEVRRVYAECVEVKKSSAIALHERERGKPPVQDWQREVPPEAEQTGRSMTLFTDKGSVRSAIDEVQAPSGDWRQMVEHCFRADGSVAFVLSVLRTFQGNVDVEDRFYFNPRGDNIRKLRRVTDLNTGKPLKPDQAGFMDRTPDLFRSAEELLRAVGRENVFPR